MFLLKKIAAPFFMPVSVVLMLALVGLFCLWFTRRQKTGKALVTVAFGLLALMAYDQISNLLAGPLEKKYPPVMNMEAVQGVKWIVVLGGRWSDQGSGIGDQGSGIGNRESGVGDQGSGVRVQRRKRDGCEVGEGIEGLSEGV